MSSESTPVPADTVRAVIEGYADAWQRGDPAMFDFYHPDFTTHWFGNNPLSGTHVGRERVGRALAELSRLTGRRLVRIVATLAGAERGAIIARESFGAGDHRLEIERVLVYTVAEGRLRECWVYDSDSTLLDRLITTA